MVYIEESRYPTTLAGKGPNQDRQNAAGGLMVSYNMLAFQIPPLTGTVVNAELHLHAQYLISSHGEETYQWRRVSNPQVKLWLHRSLGPNIYEDMDSDPVYGIGKVSSSASSISIPLGDSFLLTVNASANKKILMEGALVSLDRDPYNPQYLYLETGDSNDLTLILTLASTRAPAIVSQPADQSVYAGSDAEFHALVCGAMPLTYQWRFNGADLAGATNFSLFLPEVAPSQTGNFSVVVSNPVGVVTSAVAGLQVISVAPYFVLPPASLTLEAGDPGSYLRGMANGAPIPAYQWCLNGTNIPGATTNVLRFGLVTPSSAGIYTLVASNASGSVTSAPALLTVIPFYIYGPNDTTVLLENTAFLGANFSRFAMVQQYQWYYNGVAIENPMGTSLPLTGAPEEAGDYFVVAWNQYGAVTSRVATVTVTAMEPRFVSYLYDRTFIAGLPNYLDVAAQGGPPPVFYWYHDGVSIPDESDSRLSFSPVLPGHAGHYLIVASNYLGRATNGPITVSILPGAVSVSPSSSTVNAGAAAVFTAYYQGVTPEAYQWRFKGLDLPGETHRVLVLLGATTNLDGFYTVFATNVYGSMTSAPAADLRVTTQAPFIDGLTCYVSNCVGDYVWLTATMNGAPAPACQWQCNGLDIPGATNYALALSQIAMQQSGLYSVVLSNAFGVVTSGILTHLEVVPTSPLDDWTSLNPKPQANPLAAVAFGNGRRVAIGENGAVLVSTDAQTWTANHLGKGIHLNAVAYGHGRFVAVGNTDRPGQDSPVLLTSPDGLAWLAHGLSVHGSLTGVAFGNDRFVVVGGESYTTHSVKVVLTSPDGATWEPHAFPSSMYRASLSAVCFGNGRFVAASDSYSELQDTLFYSADGVQWTPGRTDQSRTYQAVAAADGSFVAVGDSGTVAWSADGASWTVGFLNGSAAHLFAVARGNDVFAAVGSGGQTWLSSDGQHWVSSSRPTTHDLKGLAFGAGTYTAVADAGRILVSTNGLSWSDQCLGPDTDLYGIAQGPGVAVAVGEDALLTSTDSLNWTRLGYARKLHGATYGNGMFVVVGKKGSILTSLNGNDWMTCSSGATGYLERILWAQNRFVAVGEGGLMVTSTDGTNWTLVPIDTPADLECIAYGNGIFVVGGGYFAANGAVATVLTSRDGLHWTDQPSVGFFGVRIRGIAFGNGYFVLVGNDGLTATSTNGVTWLDAFVGPENFRAVTYASGHFVAVGNDGQVMSSLDGVDWTAHRCFASMNLRDITATDSGDAVLLVGSNGEIFRSGELRPRLGVRLGSTGPELNVNGGFLPVYGVQVSTNLVDWTDWFTCTNAPPAPFVEPDGSGQPARFYRIVPR